MMYVAVPMMVDHWCASISLGRNRFCAIGGSLRVSRGLFSLAGRRLRGCGGLLR
jgi:hypothetical protein